MTEPIGTKYWGRIVRIVDGDTLIVDGWRIEISEQTLIAFGATITTVTTTTTRKRVTYRLTIVDAPERNKDYAGWLAAKQYVEAKLPPTTEVIFWTQGDEDGAFGRTLADVWVEAEDTTISSLLLRDGLAVVWGSR